LLRLRAEIVQYVRNFLLNEDHVEVQTPILADGAGGAVARSFKTSATEFPDRNINLRIAPELWLKRMVVGGFDRVFEIGPSFRNEGMQ
jgi:lysyl-tRNA synthetase class 2